MNNQSYNILKVNFHLNDICNMNCTHCFKNARVNKEYVNNFYFLIIDKLKTIGVDYINIAGGEPTIFKKDLLSILQYCNHKNIKTSIITNGYILANDLDYLETICKYVDTIGISVDSLDSKLNLKIGRYLFNSKNKEQLNLENILKISKKCHENHVKFKINTVLTKININDQSLLKLANVKIDRMKIMNVMTEDENLKISNVKFCRQAKFLKENLKNVQEFVLEPEGTMKSSYIIVNGNGELSISSLEKIKLLEKSNNDIKGFISEKLNWKDYNNRY